VRCEHGDDLLSRVRALRKARDLKAMFKIKELRCLDVCAPCVIQLEGNKRSTYLRSHIHAKDDVDRLVTVACAYAALAAGHELSERALPGDHED
jgi:predicted metal-binding protein